MKSSAAMARIAASRIRLACKRDDEGGEHHA